MKTGNARVARAPSAQPGPARTCSRTMSVRSKTRFGRYTSTAQTSSSAELAGELRRAGGGSSSGMFPARAACGASNSAVSSTAPAADRCARICRLSTPARMIIPSRACAPAERVGYPAMRFEGVIFDLGGVVLGSPLHAIARFERARGIPAGFINRVVVSSGPVGAWSRLERGELRVEAFVPAFEADCLAAGHEVAAGPMMAAIQEESQPRPAMLAAIR